MKWIIIIGILVVAVGGFASYVLSHEGPAQLNIANNLIPGENDAREAVHDLAFAGDDGPKLNVWVPTLKSEKPHPVLVFYYGGSWNSGDKDFYEFVGRVYASRGYVVVLPDYRLHPEAVFPEFMEDSAAALAWTHDNVAQYGGDPNRIFLSGHSAGAYNAVMLALDMQWLGRHGKNADLIKGVAALSGPYDFHPFTSNSTRNSFGPAHDPALTQPVNFARADAPPLWLAHGSIDTTVRPRNSKILFGKIQEAGGEAEHKVYDGLGHIEPLMALSKAFRSKATVLADSIAFFDRTSAILDETDRATSGE